MEHVDRFFGPLGASEMFLSALLGWGLQESTSARGRFLDIVEARSGMSTDEAQVRATVAALAEAEDVTVTAESYTTAGNVDLALFSRSKNAVLVVEHKTGSTLSEWQITKYRLAMAAADPNGDRKLATVLLRPSTDKDHDEKADPNGVAVSVEINHNPHLSSVFAAIMRELDGQGLGDRIIQAALRHSFPSVQDSMSVDADKRKVLLDEIEASLEESGWRLSHRAPLNMKLVHDMMSDGHLLLTVGPGKRDMLWAQLRDSATRIRQAPEGEPKHLLDLCQGSRSFSFPTPFPVHHTEKPWMGERAEDRARQVRIVVALLSKLPDFLVRE
jgi:hypothetical protein